MKSQDSIKVGWWCPKCEAFRRLRPVKKASNGQGVKTGLLRCHVCEAMLEPKLRDPGTHKE